MKKKALSALILSSAIATNIISSDGLVAKGIENKDSNNNKNISNNVTQVVKAPILNGITVNRQLIDMNYSKGVTIVPRYIVIHDTDNRDFGANAMANRNYFANHPEANASTQYTIDQSNIIQVLEDTSRSWNCGDGKNPLINNSNTIAMELCVNIDNNFDKTLENGIALTKYLMEKYKIPAERVVRHYDVSGKICPKMMIKDRPELWTYFKKTIGSFDINSNGNGENDGTSEKVDPGKSMAKGRVINVATKLNVREDSNGASKVVSTLGANEEVSLYEEKNGWYKVSYTINGTEKYGYVSKNYIRITSGEINDTINGGSNNNSNSNNTTNTTPKPEPPKPSTIKKGNVINVSTMLNVRSSASQTSTVIGYLKNNEEIKINYEENGWYNITFGGNRTGFVKKEFIKVVEENTVKPITPGGDTNNNNTPKPENPKPATTKRGSVINVSTMLNIRSSASQTSTVIGYLKNNEEIKINYEENGWYNVTFGGNRTGFAKKEFIKVIEENIVKPITPGNNNNNAQKPENPKPETTKKGKVYNISTSLNVRRGPATNQAVIAYILNGAEVEITGESGDWYKISYNGREGFASKNYVKLIGQVTQNNEKSKSTPEKIQYKEGNVINVATNLKIRTEADKNALVLGYLLPNEKVKVKASQNGWYNIIFETNTGEKEGYVSADYIKVK